MGYLSSYLVNECKFNGPFNYFIEERNEINEFSDFVKNKVCVHVNWTYKDCFIYKTKELNPNLQTGKMRLFDIDSKEIKVFQLSKLDKNRKLWNTVSDDNFPDKIDWYFYKLIVLNPRVLEDRLENTFLYKIKRHFSF